MRNIVKAAKALSDETRLRILNLLFERECCVCEVMQVLKISQTRASRNLILLFDAGFLNVRREGLWAYYSIDKSGLQEYLTHFLDGIKAGLNNNQTAFKDLEHLTEAQRLGPQCCNLMEIKEIINDQSVTAVPD